MKNYILRRLLFLVFTLLGISIIVFLLIRAIPGDVIDVSLGTDVNALSSEQMAELRAYYGLDQPLHVQYWTWLSSTLKGDFGYSVRTGRPVLSEIVDRFPVTLELTIFGVLLGTILGLIAGILSSIKRNTVWDWVSRVGALLGLSVPQFWIATLVILVLSLRFRWLPTSGGFVDFLTDPFENIKQVFLPSIILSISLAAAVMRMTRSAMLETMGEDYIRTASSKGLTPSQVIFIHALKNALIPVITTIGIQAGYLLGGTVVIEEIFALPGVGRLVLHAIYQRDYAMIQGAIMVVALNFILINLLVDILHGFFDPRIRYE